MNALDLWQLLVVQTFGGFWMAVFGIALLIFIIMALLGRISIYSTTWYIIMFILTMTIGYGYIFLNIMITLSLLIAFYFSWKSYIDSR